MMSQDREALKSMFNYKITANCFFNVNNNPSTIIGEG